MSHNPPTNEQQTKQGNLFTGVLYIMTHPGKWFVKKTHRHYKKKYRDKYKHSKKLFIFDLILLGIIAALAAVALYFAFWYTPGIVNQISLEATVAPR